MCCFRRAYVPCACRAIRYAGNHEKNGSPVSGIHLWLFDQNIFAYWSVSICLGAVKALRRIIRRYQTAVQTNSNTKFVGNITWLWVSCSLGFRNTLANGFLVYTAVLWQHSQVLKRYQAVEDVIRQWNKLVHFNVPVGDRTLDVSRLVDTNGPPWKHGAEHIL